MPIARAFRTVLALLALLALMVVPVWQAFGHAGDTGHGAACGQFDRSLDCAPDAGPSDHAAAEHSHDVPLGAPAGMGHLVPLAPGWNPGAIAIGLSLPPRLPDHPPRTL